MADMQDDYGYDWSTTGHLELDKPLKAVFEYQSDLDAFKVELNAGVTYLFSLAGYRQYGGTPDEDMGNVYLEIMDRASASLAGTAGRSDSGPVFQFTPTQSGEYLVRASQYFGSAGYYTVKATVKPAGDDFASDATTTGVLKAGGTAMGIFEVAGDSDWFKFHAKPGEHYGFGANTSGFVLPTFSLVDAAGNNVDVQSSFEVVQAGDYFATASGLEAGPYSIFSRLLEDDHNSTIATAETLAAGTTVTGGLQYRYDQDSFKISMQAGVEYKIDLASSRLDIPYLTFGLTDTAGLPVSVSATLIDNVRTWTFKPAASGDYVVNVYSDTLPAGVTRGSYQLTVTDTPSARNDLLKSNGNGAQIDAGAGIDTVEYALTAAQYHVLRKDGNVTVQASSAAVGDTLSNVERLKFADAAVAVDIDGIGGQAYRLYQAAFNRTPDKAGVGYWITQMDKGVTLHDVARSFMDSPEFQSRYGANLSDAAFVDQLYQNVLHRAGEQAGVDYWMDALAKGAPRADVLSSFSEGKENQDALVKIIGNGFSYIPYA